MASRGIVIPAQVWLPVPILSDAFSGAAQALSAHPSDGLGHSETNGGTGKTWVHDIGCWVVDATNKAVGTPTVGGDVVTNGNFAAWTGDNPDSWTVTGEVGADPMVTEAAGKARLYTSTGANIALSQVCLTIGAWYQATMDVVTVVSGGIRIGDNAASAWGIFSMTGSKIATGRATVTSVKVWRDASSSADDVTVDNVAFYTLTLSSLFSTVAAGTNLKVRVKCGTLVTGTQMGAAIINSSSAPTQGLIAYFDGAGNLRVDEFTAAATWNSLASVATAWATNDEIELHTSGTAWRVYRITSAGVATLIGSGTLTANLGTGFAGMFSTYSGNLFAGAQVWAVGNEGQYSALDALAV